MNLDLSNPLMHNHLCIISDEISDPNKH